MSRNALLATSAALAAWGVHSTVLTRRLRQARTDDLTGLHRRDEFARRVHRMLEQHPHASVLLLDLDGFKQINDALGHEVGDTLLAVTADRLRAALPTAVLGRLGGDEFVATTPHPARLTGLEAALSRPVLHQHGVTTPGVSIGVSVGPHRDLSQALSRADAAMYAAKTTGAGNETFDPRQHHRAHGRVRQLTS